MVMRDNGEIEYENDKFKYENMSPLDDSEEDELVFLVRESIVIGCTLQVQIEEDESDWKGKIFSIRDTIYKTRYVV